MCCLVIVLAVGRPDLRLPGLCDPSFLEQAPWRRLLAAAARPLAKEGGRTRLALLDVGSGASPTLLRALAPMAREVVDAAGGSDGTHQASAAAQD